MMRMPSGGKLRAQVGSPRIRPTILGFAIGHTFSAPIAWITASVTPTSPRRIGAIFG